MFVKLRRRKKNFDWQPTHKDIEKAFDEFIKDGGIIEKIDISKNHDNFVKKIDYTDSADNFLFSGTNYLSL